jgi:hypothetical protein
VSLLNVRNYILTACCDGVGVPGTAGNQMRAMSLLPRAADYYLSSEPPFGPLTWFTEAIYQATIYGLVWAYVAANALPYLVLSEQRYPGDPDNRRADLMVVDTTSNGRLAIELKSDFRLDSVRDDIGKLEDLAAEGLIYRGAALFCCHNVQFAEWINQLKPNMQAVVTPGGIFKN